MKKIFFALSLIGTLALTGCHSSSNVSQENVQNKSEEAYKQKVIANNQTAKAVTGKMKLGLKVGDKDIDLNGTLKMKRDEVIQLSLSFFGMEVARMEFATDNVLILDRFHKQYARVPYNKIDFLKSANLDFHALQSIFWNEIFVPGQHDIPLKDFTVAESGDHTLLSLKTAPMLNYGFLTATKTALLKRTTISPKNLDNQDNLVCRYGDFVKLGNHNFPSTIAVTFTGGKSYTLNMTLSSLNNDENWTTYTQVSSKYSEMNINKLLDMITIQ